MPTLDLTKQSTKAFAQLIGWNSEYRKAVAIFPTWEAVVEVIDELGITYTEEQINYLKSKDWTI